MGLGLLVSVEGADEVVGLGARGVAIDLRPADLPTGRAGTRPTGRADAARRHDPALRAFMQRRQADDALRGQRAVIDAGRGAVAPGGHVHVVNLGPEFADLLEGAVAGQPHDLGRPAALAGLAGSALVKGVKVRVGIARSVVMQGGDPRRLPLGQALGEGGDERTVLVWGCF
jgi:hypothetical protein